MTELTKLCHYIAGLRYADIPAEVIDYTQLLIADHYVSAVAGHAYNSKFTQPLVEIVNEESADGKSTTLFQERKLPAGSAALLNAVFCHGADVDDGHREAEAHPGVAVNAAVLALAEEIGASGEETLTAVVSGYEVFIRVAKSILPSHLWRGFHTTGTVGTIAAAAACAKLMGLDAQGIEKAISLASTQTAGLLIVCESGQASKPINPGRAAQTGILCAKLAHKDVDAPENVFDSKKGFTHAFSDQYKPEMLIGGLGQHFEVLDTYVKLYPSCRHTQATMEAIKKCIRENGPICDAKSIEIRTYPIAVDIVGHNRAPKTIGDVKFSIPYTAACVALYGDYTLENLANFEEEREKVLGFIEKITVVSDEMFDDIPNGIRGAEVLVTLQNGRSVSAMVPIARGEGTDRIDWPTLKEKACASCKGMSETQIENLICFCRRIAEMARFVQPELA